MRSALRLLVLPLFLLLAPGCVAVVAGAAAVGAVQYFRNEAVREYPATREATWAATLQTLRDLGYPVDPSTGYGSSQGSLEVNEVKLRVYGTEGGQTRVAVRVGTFKTQAHRDQAKRILDGIAQVMGLTTGEATMGEATTGEATPAGSPPPPPAPPPPAAPPPPGE